MAKRLLSLGYNVRAYDLAQAIRGRLARAAAPLRRRRCG